MTEEKTRKFFILLETLNINDRRKITDVLRKYIGSEIRYINVEPEIEEQLNEYGDSTGNKVIVI